jgi:hypothetical protein
MWPGFPASTALGILLGKQATIYHYKFSSTAFENKSDKHRKCKDHYLCLTALLKNA